MATLRLLLVGGGGGGGCVMVEKEEQERKVVSRVEIWTSTVSAINTQYEWMPGINTVSEWVGMEQKILVLRAGTTVNLA